MKPWTRAWKALQLRLVEMQIAMIEDYNRDLEQQQQSNDAWLKDCRTKELKLAADLEGMKVIDLPDECFLLIEIGGVTFFIRKDAEAMKAFLSEYRDSPDAFRTA